MGGGRRGARVALRTCLDATWNVTRAVVNLAFLPAEPSPSTRRIVYLAPAPGGGRVTQARRARGSRTSARTLSIEWARHGITTVTIAPGDGTTAGEVAALVRLPRLARGGLLLGLAARAPGASDGGSCLRRVRLAGHPAEQPAGDVEGLAVHVVGPG